MGAGRPGAEQAVKGTKAQRMPGKDVRPATDVKRRLRWRGMITSVIVASDNNKISKYFRCCVPPSVGL